MGGAAFSPGVPRPAGTDVERGGESRQAEHHPKEGPEPRGSASDLGPARVRGGAGFPGASQEVGEERPGLRPPKSLGCCPQRRPPVSAQSAEVVCKSRSGRLAGGGLQAPLPEGAVFLALACASGAPGMS